MAKSIPYSHQTIDAADIKSVRDVMNSDWLTQGPDIKKFEDALCRYTTAQYAVAVSSGTAALHIASLAAGFKKGDEVIIPANTFAATANAVLYAGGKPVFADIENTTGNIDILCVHKLIHRGTRGIIAVDFAGRPCDWEELSTLAKRKKLMLIDDASHAIGAAYQAGGRRHKTGCGKHADMTIFSFHPLKTITTGEGGAVLTNRRDLFEKLVLLRNHGIGPDKKMVMLGFNYRITDMQCALGISQIKKLDSFVAQRAIIEKNYRKAFEGNPYFELLANVADGLKPSRHLFPVLLKNPEHKIQVFDELRRRGLGVQTHYIPVYWHPYYRQLGYDGCYAPRAEEFYRREISLPIYPGLTLKQQGTVIDTVINVCKQIHEKDK